MSRKVRLSDQALADIEAIGDYIAERAPETAARWVARLRLRLAALAETGESHALLYSRDQVGRDVRQTFFGVYRILFEVQAEAVFVLTVRHGARRPIGAEEVEGIE